MNSRYTLQFLFITLILAFLSLTIAVVPACAQSDDKGEGQLINEPPKGITHEQVIQKFAAREKEFQQARDNYTYRQSVKVQTNDDDFQIVKTFGKAVPDFGSGNGENLFPKFTTYREQIDGKYWFPTYTIADDVLQFKKAPPVHIRQIVKYTNYKRFGSKTRIIYEGQQLPQAAPNPKPPQGQEAPPPPQ